MKMVINRPARDVLDEFTDHAAEIRNQLDDWAVDCLAEILESMETVDYAWLQPLFQCCPNDLARLLGFKNWLDLQVCQEKVYWGE